jgi:hypothetical protein
MLEQLGLELGIVKECLVIIRVIVRVRSMNMVRVIIRLITTKMVRAILRVRFIKIVYG